MPRLLTAVDLAALPLGDALDRLRAGLDGSGDAVLPAGPGPAAQAAAQALAAGTPLRDGEDETTDPTAVVVATSGSTGRPKGALLQASALRASATGTHDRLGGPGHWLLALPPRHVAGVQVLVRSIVAGTVPGVLDLHDGFDVQAFTVAAREVLERATATTRCYTALVPTQLVRLLEAGGAAAQAVAGFDAVLLGGAATTPALLRQAQAAGVRVVTTYGMSETCGGCVYDGVPLDDVQVALDQPADGTGGSIRLGGPVVARGYRLTPDAPQFTRKRTGRWFRTDDVGAWLPDGRLTVLGRADDVITTGGVKVSPQAVEAVLADLPEVAECLVVGVPDREWGQQVVALVVGRDGRGPAPQDVRRLVADRLGAAAAPRRTLGVDALPRKPLGKPDRAAAADLAARLVTGPTGSPVDDDTARG